MYLSNLDLLAVSIAIIAQMTLGIVLFISARNWEKKYRDVVRLLKTERAARR
jgi:hypothetical protein